MADSLLGFMFASVRRYWAKTATELAKHVSLAHTNAGSPVPMRSESVPSASSQVCSVVGCPPQLREKKRRRSVNDVTLEAEGEADETVLAETPSTVAALDRVAVEAEGVEEDGASLVPNLHAPESPPPPLCEPVPAERGERRQETHPYWKLFFPEHTMVVHDKIKYHRFIMILDHKKFGYKKEDAECLPEEYRTVSKSFTYAKGADNEEQHKAYNDALN